MSVHLCPCRDMNCNKFHAAPRVEPSMDAHFHLTDFVWPSTGISCGARMPDDVRLCMRPAGHDGLHRATPKPPISEETQRVVLDMEVAVQAGRVAFGETRIVAALRAGIRRLLQLETQK